MSYGFIILSTDRNPILLKNTMASIKVNYPDAHCICAVDGDIEKKQKQELSQYCPIATGGGTITSLINIGMKKTKVGWNIIVMSGTWVRPNLFKKFSAFIKDKKDIFYPIVNKKFEFSEATINGLMIHKDTFKEVGDFCPKNPLQICKLLWALDAIEKKCRFKAIVGAKLC